MQRDFISKISVYRKVAKICLVWEHGTYTKYTSLPNIVYLYTYYLRDMILISKLYNKRDPHIYKLRDARWGRANENDTTRIEVRDWISVKLLLCDLTF